MMKKILIFIVLMSAVKAYAEIGYGTDAVQLSSTTSSIEVFPGSTFSVDLGTPVVNTQDIRYAGQVSTMTAGTLNVSGNIVVTGNVWGWSFSSFGGDSSYTTGKMSGTYPIPEDYTDNEPGLVQPLIDPTFAFILTSGTSLQFRINVTQ